MQTAVLLLAAAALALSARAVSFGSTAEPSPGRSEPIVVPDADKSLKNPVPDVPEAVESGRNLFASQCAMCHGTKADGRGDLARDMKIAVPSLADPQRQKKRTDGEWFYIIGHGHKDMPPEKRLADQQKWEIVRYLRSLLKETPAK
jgi:mono/diheme cytochrome c family protein